MSADLYFTSVSSFFFSSFFFSPSNLWGPERNSRKIDHMVRSKCNLKTRVRNLRYPSLYKLGAPKPPFWTTSQVNDNFNGLYLPKETLCRQSVKCIDNYNGSPHIIPKCHELWPKNGFKLDLHFYPSFVNDAFCFIARLCKWRSANETQPNFAK